MSPREWKRLIMRALFYGILLALLIVIFFLGLATWRVYEKNGEVKERYEVLSGHSSELEAKKQSLTEELKLLNEERGLDEAIREKYLLARPGEEVIIVVDKTPDREIQDQDEREGFLSAVKKWFSWQTRRN